MTLTLMVCPNCASSELATIEQLTGYAGVQITTNERGNILRDWDGETEVDWDASQTVGIMCRACGWEHEEEGWIHELLRQPPEELDEEFEE